MFNRLWIRLAASLLPVMLAGAEIPAVRVAGLPHREVAFEIDGREVARYTGGYDVPKPFLFPLKGPGGANLTAMAHPVDPEGHRHHRSVWVGHRDVNGVNFWEEGGKGSIRMEPTGENGILGNGAWFRAIHVWFDGETPILNEERTWTLTALENGNYYLDLQMQFNPVKDDIVFGKSPYGLLGIRVAATMSVSGGDGRIMNSTGGLNETGVHGQTAQWVDYSGSAAPGVLNGITCFENSQNPEFPAIWIVRDDGWMCPSFSGSKAITLKKGEALDVQYRLYIHGPDETAESLGRRWREYAGKD